MRHILSRIASLVRGRRSRSKSPPMLLGLDLPTSVEVELSAERQADLARRLALMPLFVRETYLLRSVDRRSIDEISIRLAISPRRARQYLCQAIILLARSDQG